MPGRAAVIIGINYAKPDLPSSMSADMQGRAGLNPLRYAENDAVELAAELESAGYDVISLLGLAATRHAIINAIIEKRRAVGKDGFLIVHFSGHGDVDDRDEAAFLLPVDADPASLASTAIPLEDLTKYLRDVAIALILLDCCHSGYAVGLRGDRGHAFLSYVSDTFSSVRGRLVLAACAGNQLARELSKLEHGAFTYYALEHWRSSLGEIDSDSLFNSITSALEQNHKDLPLPVRGGVNQGRIVLRAANPKSSKQIITPPLWQPNLERRQQLYGDIDGLNEENWLGLLSALKVSSDELRGTSRKSKTRDLVARADREDWLDTLEVAIVDEKEAARQATVARQIASFWSQLNDAAIDGKWERVITLGERILELDLSDQQAQDKIALAKTELINEQFADLLSQFDTAESQNDYDKMISLGEHILEISANEHQLYSRLSVAYEMRGQNYHQTGNYDQAIVDYTYAIEYIPQQAEYYMKRGLSYYLKEDYDHAITDYTRAIELAPQQVQYFHLRAVTYEKKGNREQAIKDYTRAIKLAPQEAEYYRDRAVSHHNKADYHRAIGDYTRAIELAPQQDEYFRERGLSYHHIGDYDRAISDYTRAIELAPQAAYYKARSLSYRNKGDYTQAISDISRAIELDPQNATYYYARYILLKAVGDTSLAKWNLDRSAELGYAVAKFELLEKISVGLDEKTEHLLTRLKKLPIGANVLIQLPRGCIALRSLDDFNDLRRLASERQLRLTFMSPEKTIKGLARILGFEFEDWQEL